MTVALMAGACGSSTGDGSSTNTASSSQRPLRPASTLEASTRTTPPWRQARRMLRRTYSNRSWGCSTSIPVAKALLGARGLDRRPGGMSGAGASVPTLWHRPRDWRPQEALGYGPMAALASMAPARATRRAAAAVAALAWRAVTQASSSPVCDAPDSLRRRPLRFRRRPHHRRRRRLSHLLRRLRRHRRRRHRLRRLHPHPFRTRRHPQRRPHRRTSWPSSLRARRPTSATAALYGPTPTLHNSTASGPARSARRPPSSQLQAWSSKVKLRPMVRSGTTPPCC